MRDRRYRGRVPTDLRARLERLTVSFADRWMPVHAADALDALGLKGIAPSRLTDEERASVGRALDCPIEDAARWLQLLEDAGYGARSERKPRRTRDHGARREDRIHQLRGLLGRSVALRLPTSADTRRGQGPNDGIDPFGPVQCSHTLRPLHLGVLAAVGGLYARYGAGSGTGYLECSRGELASLVLGTTRPSGRDLTSIGNALADLAALSIQASMSDKFMEGKPPGMSPTEHPLAIPSSPVSRVQFRLGDSWHSPDDYATAVRDGEPRRAGAAGGGTVRIYLRPWYVEQLMQHKPVLLNFDVWTYHRPLGRRLYAYLQAHGRSTRDDSTWFYLGKPVLYTLGLQRTPRHRARRMIDHDLNAHYRADARCDGYAPGEYGRGRIPCFGVKLRRGRASHPRPIALVARAPAKRSVRQRMTVRARRTRLAENLRRQDIVNEHTGEVRTAAAIEELQFTRKAMGRAHMRAYHAALERGSPLPPERFASLGDP